MSDGSPVPEPFLDWYGLWPSHRKEEGDGRVWSQEPPRGVKIAIEQAQKSDVFFHKERSWEQNANLRLVTLLHEGGRYRLWYAADKVGVFGEHYVCYAESDDGLAWERPELGLVEYEGSTRNNIIATGKKSGTGPAAHDPAQRGVALRWFRTGRG